jgi:hypothetical protein
MALTWDKIGERIYQTGVDHGVLYLQDGRAIAWNGLIGVEESGDSERKSYYLDGVKFLETVTPRDFEGKLTAYTYPDEFDSVNGIVSAAEGFEVYEQPPKSFNLSYRSKIGSDLDGLDHGYKIHILYNLIAEPESYSYDTTDSEVKPIEFSWSLSGTPPKISGFGLRPTVHVTIDSLKTPTAVLQLIEDQLYGTASADPNLPDFQQLAEYFGYVGDLIIVDYGNGMWAAIDETESYISMLSDTEFQIDHSNAVFIGDDTYRIASTDETMPVENLLPNPNFETGLTGWYSYVNDGMTKLVWEQSAAWSKFGTKCARFKAQQPNDSVQRYAVVYSTDRQGGVPVTPGLYYTASVYVKTIDPSFEIGSGYSFQLSWYDINGDGISPAVEYYADEGLDGVRLVVSGIAPANAVTAALVVAAGTNVPNDIIEFYIDAAQLEVGSYASPYTD